MTLPCQPVVQIRLGTGPTFANDFVLNDPDNGILGTNVLGGANIQQIDVSNLTRQISI